MVEGANLFVQNGLGATETANGLGNLVVGYVDAASTDDMSGSHNVAVGSEHAWSGVGGLVVGYDNAIEGDYALVGGTDNTASGLSSVIVGGVSNTLLGADSVLLGDEASTYYVGAGGGLVTAFP